MVGAEVGAESGKGVGGAAVAAAEAESSGGRATARAPRLLRRLRLLLL